MRSVCFVALFALAGCGYHMHISPQNTGIGEGGSVQFHVTDAFDNPVDLTQILWQLSGGTINPTTAVWTSDVPGNYTVGAIPAPNGKYIGMGGTYPDAQVAVLPPPP